MNHEGFPVVAIVGRTNVGKSTLFNRLATNKKSIVFDAAGVTRDIIFDAVEWRGSTFQLIDTGGLGIDKISDAIIAATRAQARSTFSYADVFLFVGDGAIGVLPEDRALCKELRSLGKPVVVAVNKTDHANAAEYLYEFDTLGANHVISLSAIHGTGIDQVLDALVHYLPHQQEASQERQANYHVAIIGRCNVGKSSLMNLLMGKERSIVAPIPGTTREAVTDIASFHHIDIQITDTAGIRRKRSVHDPLELLMVKSSFHALEHADIAIMVIDVTEGKVADQELKLAFHAFTELHKALIIVFNKWDLLSDSFQKNSSSSATDESHDDSGDITYLKERLASSLEEYTHLLKKVVCVNISCKTQRNIPRLKHLVQEVWKRHSSTLETTALTLLFKEALRRKPLYKNQHLLLVHHAEQIRTAPITIMLKVNYPPLFEETQLGYFENILRKEFDLSGASIRFVVRHK